MRSLWILALLLSAGGAVAQTDAPPGGGAPPDGPAPMAGSRPGVGAAFVPGGPAVVGFNDAMKKMMADMGKPYTGDVDADFVARMVPHHQAAIDMAEIELKYGVDPKLKQLAARIISAQQREIAFMQAFAAKHPAKGGPMPEDPHMQVK